MSLQNILKPVTALEHYLIALVIATIAGAVAAAPSIPLNVNAPGIPNAQVLIVGALTFFGTVAINRLRQVDASIPPAEK